MALCVACLALATRGAPAADGAAEKAPMSRYHLTARPWKALATARTEYLDRIEGVVRFSVQHQNADGAIIDPFIKKEHQYATPYFAHALGTLLSAGRAKDLLDRGVRAMDWATRCFEADRCDGHRVFYTPALVEALDLYAPHVPAATVEAWRRRLKVEVKAPPASGNNWTTYFMKGQWLRAKAGLIDRQLAISEIERAWTGGQRRRMATGPWRLYHDEQGHPDSLAVEAVGRGNLLALVEAGYDGPSAAEIRQAAETGTLTSLLLQDASGQVPANGRTDDHVWGDVGYMLAFEAMAGRAAAAGDSRLAGQCRRAALLTFRNIDRWRRTDGPWAGSYYVTKNRFDPALRVGYQKASQYSNYNGSLMFHLAEAYLVRRKEMAEEPAPVEIGGYAVALDEAFAAAFANAGGMQMEVDLEGDTALTSMNKDYWCALGVVRFGRVGWDTRLGPSDGGRSGETGLGVSFAPTFLEGDKWVRMASVPDKYEGKFSVRFVHPLLVRCAVDYVPRKGGGGPSFRNEFVLTPDGILSTVTRTAGSERWGVTLPLLENDGAPLQTSVSAAERIARTAYPGGLVRRSLGEGGTDEQTFIVIAAAAEMTGEPPVRSTYGDLRPVRVTVSEDASRTFICPRSAGDPAAAAVRDSFRITPGGFASVLGRVEGDLYVGRTSAGGVGKAIDLDGDGNADVTFGETCGFILQLRDGRVTAVEADRNVTAVIQGARIELAAFTPLGLSPR
jgi:hypothetical protein